MRSPSSTEPNGAAGLFEQARMVVDRAIVEEREERLSSRDELLEAERLYPGRNWTAVGLGEALVSGPELLDKFKTASPLEASLVRAAIDWERSGLTRPITRDDLAELWQAYVSLLQRRQLGARAFQAARAWATAPRAVIVLSC